MQASRDYHRSFPLPVEASAELRREFMNWAEPVIADCIYQAYRDRGVDSVQARSIAAQHRRLWRAVLLQRLDLVSELWDDLQIALAQTGLTVDVGASIDESVFEELMDIVLKRFRSSNEQAKRCSMLLLRAAASIGASRRA